MISVAAAGPVWTVTLNRQDKANSLTGAMLHELCEVVRAASGDARVLILTGAGTVFSAGADLDEAREGLTRDPVWEELSGAIAALPCLTIAALNGTLAGGAFGMVLACDLRIAVAEAKFFYPVMKLGFLPQASDASRLTALIGPARAKLVLMAGARLTADEALGFGLIDRIATRATLHDEAAALAADSAGAGAEHVALIKALIL